MHSPVDQTVFIEQAEKIYKAAKHPKSFISLDSADHLLSSATDAEYVAETIAAWARRFVANPAPVAAVESGLPSGEVLVRERNAAVNPFTQEVTSDHHLWLADEPLSVGGGNLGPDPYEHLLAALGTCTSMTIRMYANRKKWPLQNVAVRLKHFRDHGEDCAKCDQETPQIDVIERHITLKGIVDEDQIKRLLQIADRCPVHRTLHGKISVETRLV
jgi:putative redox protein